MTQILTNAPIWVWPLFVGLLVLGLRARKTRRVPVIMMYVLPLLVILPLRNVSGLPGGNVIWMIFAVGYVAGLWGGVKLQTRWIVDRDGRFAIVQGESLTLVVLMIIFWANFLRGTIEAVAPQLLAAPVFFASFTVVLALCAGSFAGRALAFRQR